MTTVREILQSIEQWAPHAVAWERDNTGFQCGNPSERVKGIVVALDPTPAVVKEAVRKRANLLVCHHPLVLEPVRSFDLGSRTGELMELLIRHRISLIAAHTNLDFTEGGTSHALAEALELHDVRFLRTPYALEHKLVTFVPLSSTEKVAAALADAGAGVIGNYDSCSFQVAGKGTFRGNSDSHPAVGKQGSLEHVEEIRLEVVVPQYRLERVVRALKTAHPYEEVAYDIYPLANVSRTVGMGVLGKLRRSLRLKAFLTLIRTRLGTPVVRWTGNSDVSVRSVAVCAGSGGELLGDAIGAGADVYVTADVKYHAFHEASGRIALVDAGHFETEFPVVRALQRYLLVELKRQGANIPVAIATSSKNPVCYV